MGKFRSSSYTKREFYEGKHRFEHWYRDNTVYFITSKVSDNSRAFATERAKEIFWDRHDHWAKHFGFEPWIQSLLDNHYHQIGYLRVGQSLGAMMQRIHGSVAKLVNDLLTSRIVPFWRTRGNKDYFDGCLRDKFQFKHAWEYTKLQAVRAGIVTDYRDYPHTRSLVPFGQALQFAIEHHALMEGVRYPRYEARDR